MSQAAHERIYSSTFLEYAFLRWILDPVALPGLYSYVSPQKRVDVSGHTYYVDYEITAEPRQ